MPTPRPRLGIWRVAHRFSVSSNATTLTAMSYALAIPWRSISATPGGGWRLLLGDSSSAGLVALSMIGAALGGEIGSWR
jgi:hypothetical protein